MSNFDAVLFDFDGTVADTGEGVFESVRYAINKAGLQQPSDSEIRKFIGPPLSQSFHNFYPEITDSDVAQLISDFEVLYKSEGIYKYKIYDGIENLLRKLKIQGIKTSVASSKPQAFIDRIVESSVLIDLFDVKVGVLPEYREADKCGIINEAICRLGLTEKSRILMIGDRKFDIVGAHKAGIACAAVLFGYGNMEEFRKYNADYIVNDCKQLEKIIF